VHNSLEVNEYLVKAKTQAHLPTCVSGNPSAGETESEGNASVALAINERVVTSVSTCTNENGVGYELTC